jgi:1-phosphofructokinase family hexose kinase
MILTVTPNPCVDKTVFIDHLEPGARIRSPKCTCIPGGKGSNVSRAVKALGGDTAALVIVGGPTGQHVVDMITQDDGVRCVPVWVKAMTRTITTVLEESIHRQTAFFEPGPAVTEAEVRATVDAVAKELPAAKVVTFNGSMPDPSLDGLYADGVRLARAAGVLAIADSYGEPFRRALAEKPYMVKPNAEEAEGLVGYALDSDAARWKAVDWFHAQGVELVVLSLGAEGALVSRDGERLAVHPPKIEEINPVGSGDSLVAGFAFGLERDLSLEDTARLGIAAGTANAMSWDIGHFTREEVDDIARQVVVERL